MVHKLNIKYEFAKLHLLGFMDWEIRKNDRNFKTGDIIKFQIIGFGKSFDGGYGRVITNVFMYPKQKFGLQPDHVILSIQKQNSSHGKEI